jgi:hypothetical protein
MIAPISRANAHFSTEVRLSVELDDEVLELSAVGPEFMTLTQPRRLRTGPATLVIQVDGDPRRSAITVVEPDAPTRRIAYLRG